MFYLPRARLASVLLMWWKSKIWERGGEEGRTLYATAEPPSSPHPTASLSPSMPLKVLPLPAYLIESGSISSASCCNPPVGGAKLSLAVLNATAWHHQAAAESWHTHTHARLHTHTDAHTLPLHPRHWGVPTHTPMHTTSSNKHPKENLYPDWLN